MYENYHEKFKEECFLRNRSAGTTGQYWSAIKTFMKWCDYKPMEELTIQDARNYILSKGKAALNPKHVTSIILPSLFCSGMSYVKVGTRN